MSRTTGLPKALLAFAVVVFVPLQGTAHADAPTLTTSQTVGAPTSAFFVSGSGFQGSEVVDVSFDDAVLLGLLADVNGNFTHFGPLNVPVTALPGTHTLTAVGLSSGLTATSSFLVRTNWPRFHFDNGNTAYNNLENVLNTTNVSSLVEKWAVPTAPGATPNPIVAGGLVYVSSFDGFVRALDPTTGATVWATGTGAGMNHAFAPTFSNGRLFVGNNNGDSLALDAKTGTILWDVSLGIGTQSTPIVGNNLVYVEAVGEATASGYALDVATGTTEFTTCAFIHSPSLAYGILNTVYPYNGLLFGCSASNGATVWEDSLGGEVTDVDSPAVSNGTVFAGIEGACSASTTRRAT